jgi:hypothetical protein
MSGNLLVRFDEGRVGRTLVSPSLLLYRESACPQTGTRPIGNRPAAWQAAPRGAMIIEKP